VGRWEKGLIIKKNSHRRNGDAKLLADRCSVRRDVLCHHDTNGIIKFCLEEIAIHNVNKSVSKSSQRLDSFGMLPELKIKILTLLPKRQLLWSGLRNRETAKHAITNSKAVKAAFLFIAETRNDFRYLV